MCQRCKKGVHEGMPVEATGARGVRGGPYASGSVRDHDVPICVEATASSSGDGVPGGLRHVRSSIRPCLIQGLGTQGASSSSRWGCQVLDSEILSTANKGHVEGALFRHHSHRYVAPSTGVDSKLNAAIVIHGAEIRHAARPNVCTVQENLQLVEDGSGAWGSHSASTPT